VGLLIASGTYLCFNPKLFLGKFSYLSVPLRNMLIIIDTKKPEDCKIVWDAPVRDKEIEVAHRMYFDLLTNALAQDQTANQMFLNRDRKSVPYNS
jgi:hypothetical protein